MNDMALHTIELFAGVGMLGEGIDAGLKYMGIDHRTVCYVEREAYAASVLVARMEEGSLAKAPIWSDVTTFDATKFNGKVDGTVAEANDLAPRDLSAAHRFWHEADAPHQLGYGKLRPSIHMPRIASRILLEIVSVRVERLHEISEADAQAEGVERVVAGVGWRRYCDPDIEEVGVPPCGDARRSFRSLWKHINGDESWNANPWVWVVEFKRVQP